MSGSSPIAWYPPRPDGSLVGLGADSREYLVEPQGSHWRWERRFEGIAGSYAAGGFTSQAAATEHAEHHEKEDQEFTMAKKKTEKKNGAANGTHDTTPADALTGTQRPGGIERARFVEQLACRMDATQKDALRDRLVAVTLERVSKETEAAALKEAIKGLSKREDALADQLRDEAEMRDVDCVERLYVETNTVDTIRLDTGEVVRSRPATAEDRQEDLDNFVNDTLDKAVQGAKGAAKDVPPPAGDGAGDGA